MGWLRTIFLGDIGNRLDIADNEARIATMRTRIRDQTSTDRMQDRAIGAVQERCEQLELTVGSLVKLLAVHEVVPEAELQTLVNALEPEETG